MENPEAPIYVHRYGPSGPSDLVSLDGTSELPADIVSLHVQLHSLAAMKQHACPLSTCMQTGLVLMPMAAAKKHEAFIGFIIIPPT